MPGKYGTQCNNYAGIGLEPRDARFCILNLKIAHNSNRKCAIYASIVHFVINRWKLRTELVKITHKTVQKMRDLAH